MPKETILEYKSNEDDVKKHKRKDKSFTIILIILSTFLICLIGYSFFDKMNGQGTRTYDNGDKYVGEWLDGKSNGQGTYTYANGNKYVGQMKENKQDGLGSFTYVNGDKYVGQMKENKQDGQGTMTYADGTKYVGEWKNGNEDGKGTFTTNETKYVGEHKNGVMHGQGTMSSSDGTKYVGVWKDGEMHGVGSYTSADGTKYLGEWKDSQMHGQGTMSSSDFKYVGEWKDNQLHGQGTMINFYGSKYVGEFKDDEYHGQGTMTYSNGTVVKGLWGNGEFLGEEDAKKVIKAQYYLELAGDRMKVDGSGRFDMSKEDWNYVVENLSKSLDLDADLLMAYLFRGNAYYYMGKYRKSMKDYKKITRIPKYRFESTDELLLLSMAHIRLGNAKLKLKLNYCKEYKKACDLGDCLEYNRLCK